MLVYTHKNTLKYINLTMTFNAHINTMNFDTIQN